MTRNAIEHTAPITSVTIAHTPIENTAKNLCSRTRVWSSACFIDPRAVTASARGRSEVNGRSVCNARTVSTARASTSASAGGAGTSAPPRTAATPGWCAACWLFIVARAWEVCGLNAKRGARERRVVSRGGVKLFFLCAPRARTPTNKMSFHRAGTAECNPSRTAECNPSRTRSCISARRNERTRAGGCNTRTPTRQTSSSRCRHAAT